MTKLFGLISICTLLSVIAETIATTKLPVNYGFILFPAFDVLDVFGPLSPLNLLSLEHKMNLSLISTNLSAVSTKPRAAAMNRANSSFGESILPTHTFANAPKDLDVLFVPGGLGTRSPAADIQPHINFINTTYPRLQYLVTVCTGAGLAARAGVLDGRRATTNKRSWNETTALRPQVRWVSHARWVRDGNIFSGSGVSAAIDTTLAFIEHVYGNDTSTTIANGIEYVRYPNASYDPFSELYHLP